MSGHSKWNNIKRKKEKTDGARAKVFTKIGREISVAVRMGGPNPASNSKNDLLHTGNFLDFLDLPILDICRNDIGCQCQIPNNIQRCTIQCLLGDGGSHAVLLLLQLPPILHGAAISSCNLIRGKALFQGRGVL